MDVETEEPKNWVTYPKLYKSELTELEFEPRESVLRSHTLIPEHFSPYKSANTEMLVELSFRFITKISKAKLKFTLKLV
jgi:hypothetical protein